MDSIDSYLLAIGNPLSSEIISAINIDPKYHEYIRNTERAERGEYIYLEVRRSNAEVVIATYVTQDEKKFLENPAFKVVVNH